MGFAFVITEICYLWVYRAMTVCAFSYSNLQRKLNATKTTFNSDTRLLVLHIYKCIINSSFFFIKKIMTAIKFESEPNILLA